MLPHWRCGGSTYFVTFRSVRGDLPAVARNLVQSQVRRDHGLRYLLSLGVVMPDHVHLILRPTEREPNVWWDLGKITQGIKGGSARRINQALGTQGTVWQKESFDRIVRDESEFEEKVRYVYENPFRAGLVADPEEYEFFIVP